MGCECAHYLLPQRGRLLQATDVQYLDVTGVAMVPYHNKHTPRENGAQCSVMQNREHLPCSRVNQE